MLALLPGRGHAAGRVDNVDNVDNQFLSAGLVATRRGGHAIVDNVDNLKTISPHCPQYFDLRGAGAEIVDNVDNLDAHFKSLANNIAQYVPYKIQNLAI